MVPSSFRSPGLGQALGAIGALGLFVATGFACGSGTPLTPPSTLAPIMATGPAHASLSTAGTERKCLAR
jgi:hypothetical protein